MVSGVVFRAIFFIIGSYMPGRSYTALATRWTVS